MTGQASGAGDMALALAQAALQCALDGQWDEVNGALQTLGALNEVTEGQAVMVALISWIVQLREHVLGEADHDARLTTAAAPPWLQVGYGEDDPRWRPAVDWAGVMIVALLTADSDGWVRGFLQAPGGPEFARYVVAVLHRVVATMRVTERGFGREAFGR